MAAARPKYSLAERERRWLVRDAAAGPLLTGTPLRVRDRYLRDTRLRLRRISAGDGGRVYKLCKKYGDFPAGAESITNLYLAAEEFALLAAALPGWEIEKRRYRLHDGSIDVYERGRDRLLLFEREFVDSGSAAAYQPPAYVTREITADPDFTGAALARRFGDLRPAP